MVSFVVMVPSKSRMMRVGDMVLVLGCIRRRMTTPRKRKVAEVNIDMTK